MTATTVDINTPQQEGELQSHPVAAATQIKLGTLVAIDASGYLVDVTDSAAVKFAGVSAEGVDNTAGAAGDLSCKVYKKRVHELVSAGLTQADLGCDLYAVDNQTVQKAPTNVYVGKLARYSSATVAPVDIAPAVVAAPALAELLELPMAAAKAIASGDLVALDGDGYAVPANDVTAVRFMGVAREAANNGAGLDGAITCFVSRTGVFNMTAAGLTAADAGKELFCGGAQTVQLAPTRMKVGRLARYSSAIVAPTDIGPATAMEGHIQRHGVAAAKAITAGDLVASDGDGYLVRANDATAVQFRGVALDSQNNGAGADGDLVVTVLVVGMVRMTAAGLAAKDAGKDLYIGGATTVTLTPGLLRCGRLAYFSAATEGNLEIEPSPAEVRYGVSANLAIAQGDLVGLDADGFACPADDATCVRFLGVALETISNVGGADGDVSVGIRQGGKYRATAAGLTAADVGKALYVGNATTVTTVPGLLRCGFLDSFTNAIHGNLEIQPSPQEELFGVTAAKAIVRGELVALDSSGYALAANDATAVAFLGVALDSQNNGAGLDGALSVTVRRCGPVRMTAAGLTADDVGKPLYVGGVTTVTLTPGDVYVGKLEKYTAAVDGNLLMDDATKEPFDIDGGGSRGRLFTLNFQFVGLPAAGAVTACPSAVELPRKFRVLSGFGRCQTAPGGAVVVTVRLSDGVTNYDFTVTGAAFTGEIKTVAAAPFLAATDVTCTITEGGGGISSDYGIFYICEEL